MGRAMWSQGVCVCVHACVCACVHACVCACVQRFLICQDEVSFGWTNGKNGRKLVNGQLLISSSVGVCVLIVLRLETTYVRIYVHPLLLAIDNT